MHIINKFETVNSTVDEEILQRTYEDCQEDFDSPAFAAIFQRFEALREDLQFAATREVTHLDPLPEDASEERKKESAEWKQILAKFVDNISVCSGHLFYLRG